MHVCSQPWVTAKSLAASREAKVLSNRNTWQLLPLPWARRTEKEARKRPQSVGCVAGETTYLPMEIAWFGILFNQVRRLGSAGGSFAGLGWLPIGKPKGRGRREDCGRH